MIAIRNIPQRNLIVNIFAEADAYHRPGHSQYDDGDENEDNAEIFERQENFLSFIVQRVYVSLKPGGDFRLTLLAFLLN